MRPAVVVEGMRTEYVSQLGDLQRTDDGDKYGGADKSLARPRRKQATATEDFDFHISYLKP